MRENKLHDLIITDNIIKQSINNILLISNEAKYIHEDTYINGITADFTVLDFSQNSKNIKGINNAYSYL